MITKELKDTIGLTDYQQSLVTNFLDAARRMKDAGVYAFSNNDTGNVYFVNSLNVKNFWLGEDELGAPFDNDFESVEQNDIDNCDCISVFLSDVFDNYAFPYDLLCFEKK